MSVPAEHPEAEVAREPSAPVGIGRVCVTWKLERARSVAEPGPLELRWTLSSSGPNEADLTDAAGRTQRIMTIAEPARFGFDDRRRMLHVDVASGGQTQCAVTLDVSGPRPRLLYARTDIIAEFGVPGGCAEITSLKTG